jgi:hypothetical protein
MRSAGVVSDWSIAAGNVTAPPEPLFAQDRHLHGRSYDHAWTPAARFRFLQRVSVNYPQCAVDPQVKGRCQGQKMRVMPSYVSNDRRPFLSS